MTRRDLPQFEPLAYPDLENLKAYLSEEDRSRLREILEKTLNHRTSVEERYGYTASYAGGLDYEINAPRRYLERNAILPADMRSEWAGQLGLELADIRELVTICKRFTAEYNNLRRTELTQTDGRNLLLRMAQADQLSERVSRESKDRRERLARHEVSDFLLRHASVRPASDFRNQLSDFGALTWDRIPYNGALMNSSREDDLRLYYKTSEGDYGFVRILPTHDPLVIDGHIYRDRNQILAALERYTDLKIRFPTNYPNGVEQDGCLDLIDLFDEINGILKMPRHPADRVT